MSCSSCGTKTNGAPTGCKSNGNCGTSGCNALNVYDWFKDMDLPDDFEVFNIVEIRYKGSRKEYYRNTSRLELYTGDYVVTEGSMGFDIGTVSAMGEIVRLQLKKLRISESSQEIKTILRKATERDLEKFTALKDKENATLERARTISFSSNLAMKLSDIEFQGDGRKVTFFYTAESRVDFRELIRKYADEFKVKIEMRHISYREEASRLGGIGVCGRQLCCSTWLTDYKQVNTGAARIQNLSINMEKLAGQCGKLKCCLNYELDLYLEAVDEFPKSKIVKINTLGGTAIGRKTDILKRLMWFSYEDSPTWVALPVAKVNEIIEQNKQGIVAPTLSDLAPASQVMEKIAEHANAEIIGNAELLKEDKEFEDEMRRQKEQRDQNKGNRGNTHRDNRHSGNQQNRGPRPEHQNRPPQKPGEHRGPNPNQNRGPKPNDGQNRGPNPNNQRPGNRNNPNRGPRPNNRPNNPPSGPPKKPD
jgi:cell fate regulator YaaT (PSP1 superfamily)